MKVIIEIKKRFIRIDKTAIWIGGFRPSKGTLYAMYWPWIKRNTIVNHRTLKE